MYRLLIAFGVVRGGGPGGEGVKDTPLLLEKGLGPFDFLQAAVRVKTQAEATAVAWELRTLLGPALMAT